MLKNIIVLEINSKKDMLRQIEIETPSEFMFANNTKQILNCHIFEGFIDSVFELITKELAQKFDEKIKNVYTTFIDEYDEFVCSVIIDKLNTKRQTYRVKVIDWQSSGRVFKYIDNEDDSNGFNNDLKPEF